jgi:copper resistance protein B
VRVFATALAPILLTITPAAAQDHSAHTQTPPAQTAPAQAPDPHARHVATPSPQPAPAIASDAQANAADLYFDPAMMARAREQLRVENGEVITHAIILDRLEATSSDGAEGYAWDAQGWYGGDINRFWWKSEGEGAFENDLEDAELQLLYSRAVTPYFDLQGGVRQSYLEGEDRTDLVLGVQGLAPYWFEVDAAAFVSTEGDVTARAEAEYDLRLTQRLILQPSAELNFAAQDIPDLDMGAGFTDAEVGLRLRYEFSRRFAPYVGVEWTSALGETRDIREALGEDTQSTRAVIGLRALF